MNGATLPIFLTYNLFTSLTGLCILFYFLLFCFPSHKFTECSKTPPPFTASLRSILNNYTPFLYYHHHHLHHHHWQCICLVLSPPPPTTMVIFCKRGNCDNWSPDVVVGDKYRGWLNRCLELECRTNKIEKLSRQLKLKFGWKIGNNIWRKMYLG